MTGIADRDWESMLDRIDLDVSDAELAAAEQQLMQLAPEDVVPVRAEWLEATVAKVRAEAARDAAAAAPVRELSFFRRVQRFAAAAAAVVGIHSFATAATVATVGVVAVAAVVVIWKASAFSRETMPFRMAIEIQLRADQPAEDRVAALTEVSGRVIATIEALQRLRNSSQSPTLIDGARQALRKLESQLLGTSSPEVNEVGDVFEASLAILERVDASASLRMEHLQLLLAASQTAIAAILRMPQGVEQVDEARAGMLTKLTELISR